MPDFSTPQSALNALDVVLGTTAHNIANSSTDGYKAVRADLETGLRGQGVRVGGIVGDMSPGPANMTAGMTEASNVDLSREFARLNVTETAYSAVAASIRTMDELTGSILNVKA